MMVFYHLVRMQNIWSNLNHKYIYITYLIALRIIPFPLNIICYFLLFYQNLCFQQLHCHLHVLVLISFCLALSITQLFDTHLCNNSSRNVWDEPHVLSYLHADLQDLMIGIDQSAVQKEESKSIWNSPQ